MPNEEYKSLRDIIEALIKTPSPLGELPRCPECGGELRVDFAVYTRGVRRMLGVRAQCNNCGITAYFDYALPKWLEDEQ